MKIQTLALLLLMIAGCKPQYLKFDGDPPGRTPKHFAKNLISPNNEHVGYCAFSPDGHDLYYAITNDQWSISKIIKISADALDKKDTLYLKDRNYEGEPFITKDGNTLYFMAVLPPLEGMQWHSDLYKVSKNGNGWGKPEQLDSAINSSASEWHISLTNCNVAYFVSEREKGTSALHGDIYRAELAGSSFVNQVKLPFPINTEFNDSDPLIAPDENFLIFHSDRPGGVGQHDLYISFNNKGKWTDPVNMGEIINSEGWEMAPTLSLDGKYLFYTYRQDMVTDKPAKIYWVSTKILDEYK